MRVKDSIVYEDNHLLLINKDNGVLVQGDKTGDVSLLDLAKVYVKEKYKKPGDVFLQPVHRIDRSVSGLCLFARTSKATARLNELFRKQEIRKYYLAISTSRPDEEEGLLVDFIAKDEKLNQVKKVRPTHPGAKEAKTRFKLLNVQANKSLFLVEPITGRPHQIRFQMSRMGCPLLGDTKYGASSAQADRAIGLHSFAVIFAHPVLKEEQFYQCLPGNSSIWRDFSGVIRGLHSHEMIISAFNRE